MPPEVIVFCIIQGAVSLYAVSCGGQPERLMGCMLAAAFLATVLIEQPDGSSYDQMAIATLMIDGTLFAGMVGLALRANRYWTLWIAGIHATTLATHLIRALNADLLPNVYHFAAAISAFPIMLILTIATIRHRERTRQLGIDRSWSDYYDPLTPQPPMAGQMISSRNTERSERSLRNLVRR